MRTNKEKTEENRCNVVAIFPTSTGLTIGGDASAGSYISLLSSVCNKLIVNPNGLFASDMYAGTNNTWMVEGSTLNRFLSNEVNLKGCNGNNKILCVVNHPISPSNINAVNASRWMLGAEIDIMELNSPLVMNAFINKEGRPDGKLIGVKELIDQVKNIDFDILAVHTIISCPEETSLDYWNGKLMYNPWGYVEQKLSKQVSKKINKQTIHAPVETEFNTLYNSKIVRIQQAPEIISNTYAHCIFSGAHQAPTIDTEKKSKNMNVEDINFLVSPTNCWGKPHEICKKAGIPIIIVEENSTLLTDVEIPHYNKIIRVRNYLECIGIIQTVNIGINYRQIIDRQLIKIEKREK